MIKLLLIATGILAAIHFPIADVSKPSFDKNQDLIFPGGAKAAICLTYDDGMKTHLLNAIPQLNEAGFKGSFYINNVSGQKDVAGWMNAARQGHELGNHSLFHPCPDSLGWPKELITENYTAARMIKEIEVTNQILQLLDPSTPHRTYAYPCNNIYTGGKSYIDELTRSGLVKYARGGGTEKNCIIKNFKQLDPMHVPSYIAEEDSDSKQLIAMAEKVKQQGGLLVFQFHGVGGEWIKIANETHRNLLAYLKDNKKDIWVTTFYNAMQYIEANKNK